MMFHSGPHVADVPVGVRVCARVFCREHLRHPLAGVDGPGFEALRLIWAMRDADDTGLGAVEHKSAESIAKIASHGRPFDIDPKTVRALGPRFAECFAWAVTGESGRGLLEQVVVRGLVRPDLQDDGDCGPDNARKAQGGGLIPDRGLLVEGEHETDFDTLGGSSHESMTTDGGGGDADRPTNGCPLTRGELEGLGRLASRVAVWGKADAESRLDALGLLASGVDGSEAARRCGMARRTVGDLEMSVTTSLVDAAIAEGFAERELDAMAEGVATLAGRQGRLAA